MLPRACPAQGVCVALDEGKRPILTNTLARKNTRLSVKWTANPGRA